MQRTFYKTCLLLLLFTGLLITVPMRVSIAACPSCSGRCGGESTIQWNRTVNNVVNPFTTNQFVQHRDWIVNTLWANNILPAMMMMADQLSAVAMHQTAIIGTFFDAKQQLETQRTLQKIRARAHKDYHPSTGMCEFGSTVKSLAASERKSELAAHVMAQRFQDRMLGNANTSAVKGPGNDKASRLKQFAEKFCDPMDFDGALKTLCTHGGGVGGTKPQRLNKDIDFLRTVMDPWTLNVDFSDNKATDEEEEILALADNLYGHEVFERISAASLKPEGSQDAELPDSLESYMDARAALAKLSVAENSFNAITSMKAAGEKGSRDYLEAIMKELGIDDANPADLPDMKRLLGFDGNENDNPEIGPSYYAQMEVLTKKIYQNPDFYTNLYDKPANVDRKMVAMQAIGLMQKFDMYKSQLRKEASLSVLLELAVDDLQKEMEEKTRDQTSSGQK